MSQVVVTKDKLAESRKKSLDEEKKIEVNDYTLKWHKSFDAKPTLLETFVVQVVYRGLALVWGALFALVVFSVGFACTILRGMGTVFNSAIASFRPRK